MYITAQRVVTRERVEGVNTYLSLHGTVDWTHFVPEENPGTLERRLITIEPNQNLIVSYLDLVFPDDAPLPWLSPERPLRQWVMHPTGIQRFAWDSRLGPEEMVLLYCQCKALFESYQGWKLMGQRSAS